jgi:hypothetical protein
MKFLKDRSNAIIAVISSLLWRGFGIFLFILGGSAGVGAALTGNWITGVLISWGTLMIGLIGAIGYAIATTGRATPEDVARASKDAVQKAKEQQKKG